MVTHEAGPSRWAQRLGFGGLIPFVGLAIALWLLRPDDWPIAKMALLGYGTIIVGFLGAIHWGLVMREGPVQPMSSLLWGVVPSLMGWVALLLGGAPGLLLTAASLWACYAADRALYPRYELQAWLPMRWWFTMVASLSCLAGAAALLRLRVFD